MKLLLLLFIIIFTLTANANTFKVIDSVKDLQAIKRTFDLLNINWTQPKSIPNNFIYNNSNGKISPGEMVVIKLPFNKNREQVFNCKILTSVNDDLELLSQKEYQVLRSLDSTECLDHTSYKCITAIYDIPFSKNQILLAINKWVRPGDTLICYDLKNPLYRFSQVIID